MGIGAPKINKGVIIANAATMLAASATGDGKSAGLQREQRLAVRAFDLEARRSARLWI